MHHIYLQWANDAQKDLVTSWIFPKLHETLHSNSTSHHNQYGPGSRLSLGDFGVKINQNSSNITQIAVFCLARALLLCQSCRNGCKQRQTHFLSVCYICRAAWDSFVRIWSFLELKCTKYDQIPLKKWMFTLLGPLLCQTVSTGAKRHKMYFITTVSFSWAAWGSFSLFGMCFEYTWTTIVNFHSQSECSPCQYLVTISNLLKRPRTPGNSFG